ncbi:MAG: DUF4256 domain-containing protein [Ignavibacteriae bacterium HGW-Ignavibacteriae-4]|jgi:hypothetical protein|nr:MAG: DUF4256 domain-containing protein [Ignavibacteriae bacterium HGW-Ignavibacteriae-4]
MKKKLSKEIQAELLSILKERFENNMNRHKGINWQSVQSKLESSLEKLCSLNEMELSGGEPDVVGFDSKTNEFIFFDCSAESPKGRRSISYDHKALEARKKFPPEDSAINMASQMGIEILDEVQYRKLQMLGSFDCKTSSWIKTPDNIRKLGGAIFADLRYDNVFIYHNGADSYYAARGFSGSLRV